MNLLKSLAQTSSMTLLSRIFGFLRDVVVAHAFGAAGETDAFVVAFRLPNLLRRLFAEGAFSQAFVPLLAAQRAKHGDEAARHLVDHVASVLVVALLVTTLLGVLFAPQILWMTAPGFHRNPAEFALTAQLLRITFPYIFFIALVALSAGILNTWSRFWVPAITPIWLNVAFLFFVLALSRFFHPPVAALAWGALAGGVLQLLFQWPFLRQLQMVPRWRWDPFDPRVRRVLKLMGPAVIGVSVGQISLLLSTLFSSYLPTGSISWLFYADRLMEFPTGLLGAALGTILLPSLARTHAMDDQVGYSALLDWGLRLTLMLTLPAALALALIGVPLVSTLFMRGAFGPHDVVQVDLALLAYSLGLMGLISIKILAPGFYARQDIKTPVKIALLILVLTQGMNALFIGPLHHAGLALATSLGACGNAGLLYWGLRRRGVYRPGAGWSGFLLKLGGALGVMGAVLWIGQGAESFWLTAPFGARIRHLIPLLVGAGGSYFATLWGLGFRLRDFSRHAVPQAKSQTEQ
ncbi:murein biosynthesis integral membrane protein MurJ [Ferrovum sp.]|uniref:murein biosynthesis integral membrane protein MurJ n=1 Tax=Ferrovum sp. TaxID=2609467 RepID=UPI00261139B5|nr:murein biosynthesis integral membrane protein MurJ [Ferrovum sp.]